MQYLTVAQIKAVNQRVLSYTGNETSLVLEPKQLSVIVEQPQMTFDGQELYPTLALKAAYIFQKLTKKHLFENGNKRTALECMVLFLGLNGYEFMMPDKLTIEVVLLVTTAPDTSKRMEKLAEQIKRYLNPYQFAQ